MGEYGNYRLMIYDETIRTISDGYKEVWTRYEYVDRYDNRNSYDVIDCIDKNISKSIIHAVDENGIIHKILNAGRAYGYLIDYGNIINDDNYIGNAIRSNTNDERIYDYVCKKY